MYVTKNKPTIQEWIENKNIEKIKNRKKITIGNSNPQRSILKENRKTIFEKIENEISIRLDWSLDSLQIERVFEFWFSKHDTLSLNKEKEYIWTKKNQKTLNMFFEWLKRQPCQELVKISLSK